MGEDRYESGGNVSTAITFLLIGLGAGTIVGMLLAPKAGKQMRRDLRRGYDSARETFDLILQNCSIRKPDWESGTNEIIKSEKF